MTSRRIQEQRLHKQRDAARDQRENLDRVLLHIVVADDELDQARLHTDLVEYLNGQGLLPQWPVNVQELSQQ